MRSRPTLRNLTRTAVQSVRPVYDRGFVRAVGTVALAISIFKFVTVRIHKALYGGNSEDVLVYSAVLAMSSKNDGEG